MNKYKEYIHKYTILKRAILKRSICLVVALLMMSGAFLSLGMSTAQAAEAAPKVTVSKKTLYAEYNTYRLKLKNLTEDAVVTYKSSKPKVAKVSSTGRITPLKKGITTVTVTVKQNNSEYALKVKITVKNPYLSFTEKIDKIEVNSEFTFKAKTVGLKKAELVYSVKPDESMDDGDISTIESETGLFNANRMGTTIVVVTDQISGISIEHKVEIVDWIDPEADLIRYEKDGDFVFFGYYPQSEITGKALTSKIKKADYGDDEGVAVIDGVKVFRVTAHRLANEGDGKWKSGEYRYFKFEPIKWKIINKSADELLLLSEYSLAANCYDTKDGKTAWKDSYLRLWLNGAESYENLDFGEDYTFLYSAFTEAERGCLKAKSVEGVKDKVYLLSYEDVRKTAYGFVTNSDKSTTRICYNTEYASAFGAIGKTTEGTWWWIRTPANTTTYIGDGGQMAVYGGGKIEVGGLQNGMRENGVRPVISIDISNLEKAMK